MAKLALHGGEPVINRPLGKPWPIYGELEEQMLLKVLHSGKWWRGAYAEPGESMVGQFENAFARFQDAQYAVAVTNGTTAIECALKAIGVEAGDEVIVPAVTFVASATAVIQVGAVPIFCDINPRDYNLSLEDVEAKISDKTRAIVAVDYGGMPCDMDALNDLARRRGVMIVSDCAHSHGSQWKGKGTGALGHIGTFSFQMGKTLTTGEGGMILTNDASLAEKAYSYHHIGRVPGRPFYEHHVPSSNLRMTEWQGAIGLAQLSRLPEQTATREENSNYLSAGLAEIEGLEPIYRDPRVTRWGFYFWHFQFHSEGFGGISRNTFFHACAAEGLRLHTGHTQPLYQNPVFQESNFGRTGFPVRSSVYGKEIDYRSVVCPEAERIYATEACALGHALFLGGREEMDLVLETLRKVRANVDSLRE